MPWAHICKSDWLLVQCSVCCKKYLQHNPEKSEAEQAVEKVLEVMESDELGREEEGQGEVEVVVGPNPLLGEQGSPSPGIPQGMSRTFPRPYHTIPYHTRPDNYKPLQTTTEHYGSLHTTRDHYRPLQTTTDHYKPLKIATDHYKPLQTTTNQYWPLQTATDHQKPLQTTTNH